MPFRDDRDALLARADALEREAERLRAENRSLRDAADAQRQADQRQAEQPVASVSWEEGALVIRSPELETAFMGKRWWNSTVKVHRWFPGWPTRC